jgi:site-specific recombinase XerD
MTLRRIAPRPSRGAVFLRVDRRGQYQLVDARRRPIARANRFLIALVVRGLSPATVRAYGFDLVVLYRWLQRRRCSLASLSGDKLLQYVAAQRLAGAQPTTINRRLTTARLFYRFCCGRELDARGALTPAPYYRGPGRDRQLGLHLLPRRRQLTLRVKVPRRVVEPLTGTEVRQFLRTLPRYRDLAIVHLLLLCGLRSAEVLQLQLGDVLVEDGQLRIHGKGNRERMLPLPHVVARSIADYVRWERPAKAKTPRLFVVLKGPRRGHPMTLAGLRSLFRYRRRVRAVARANPHRFRHTFGADMARSGVRLPILQRMMGHADGSTTLRYIQLSLADIADEYRRAVAELQRRYRTRR